jgi:tungstate transport system substrate-binding protein
MVRKVILSAALTLIVIGGAVVAVCTSGKEPQERLRVATTTSLYDTGLWGYLEPMFERRYGVELDILYAGSGIAFEYGRRCDVDVIVTHDRVRELQFVDEGWGSKRVPFAYNYFLIVGPPEDPVGIKGLSPEEALRKLIETKEGRFVSRGDESGTHAKEKSLWREAGFEYEVVANSGGWYVQAGRGMGPTLSMASEMGAYTLTDVGTFLSYKGKLNLVPLIDRGQSLLNVYSVIPINAQKCPGANIEMADNLVSFLVSVEVQGFISNYGVSEYGVPLFYPCAGAEPAS